jgi:pimeloyl-ACP methyl ester carboxylesterase
MSVELHGYKYRFEIVLVGFSYGGFVITGALEHIAERVSHLVYLEALVPKNGETVLSHLGREARAKIELGQNWLVTGPVREFDSRGSGVDARTGDNASGRMFHGACFPFATAGVISVRQNLH